MTVSEILREQSECNNCQFHPVYSLNMLKDIKLFLKEAWKITFEICISQRSAKEAADQSIYLPICIFIYLSVCVYVYISIDLKRDLTLCNCGSWLHSACKAHASIFDGGA